MNGDTWEEAPRKRGPLYRDPENGIVLGVCAGIAERYDLNRFWTRVFAFFALWTLTLPTLVVYFTLGLLLKPRPLAYRGYREERDFWRRAAHRARNWRDGDGY